jgi:ferredoxin
VDRWNILNLKQENDPPTHEIPLSRRGFLSGAALGALAAGAVDLGFGAITAKAHPVVRPPGSVPEEDFLALCIRCGECFAACPNNVLQPMGFEGGLNSLWTPKVVPNWSGCEVTCTNCGQVCPTGAIRALPIEEKRVARMGLAIVNEKTCLPYSGREACDLCRFECQQAGYNAIEFRRVAVVVDQQGLPAEDSGFLVSKILPELCVGCGLCQTRCYGINVKTRKVLKQSAIVVHAGQGNEDRLWRGSYLTLRQREKQQRLKRQSPTAPADSYLPDFLK